MLLIYSVIRKVLHLLNTRLILSQSGVATRIKPLCYARRRNSYLRRACPVPDADESCKYEYGYYSHSYGRSKDICLKRHSLKSGVAMLESSSRGTPREEATLDNEVKL